MAMSTVVVDHTGGDMHRRVCEADRPFFVLFDHLGTDSGSPAMTDSTPLRLQSLQAPINICTAQRARVWTAALPSDTQALAPLKRFRVLGAVRRTSILPDPDLPLGPFDALVVSQWPQQRRKSMFHYLLTTGAHGHVNCCG